MTEQQADDVFLHEVLRDFLRTHNPDLLDLEELYLNLHRQKTGAHIHKFEERFSHIVNVLAVGIFFGVLSMPLTLWLIIALIVELIVDGLPDWRLMILYGGALSCLLIPALYCSYLSLIYFKQGFREMRWNERRIQDLLDTLIQDGRLVIGQIQSGGMRRNLSYEIHYHFTTEQGEKLERVYYPATYQKYLPNTPVWVLYLDDKISVLL